MASITLDMKGPYPYNGEEIDRVVEKDRIGNYALGYITKEKKFHVNYVGRSFTDLNRELKDRLEDDPKDTHFKFSYADSIDVAYEKECKNYHDFEWCISKRNKIHPAKPKGRILGCPYCSK